MLNSSAYCCVSIQDSLTLNATKYIASELETDPLTDIHETLGDKFEQHLLSMASRYVRLDYSDLPGYSYLSEGFWISFSDGLNLAHPYATSNSHSVLIGKSEEELESWKSAFGSDPHFQRVLVETEDEESAIVCQYQFRENGLIYLEDWNGNFGSELTPNDRSGFRISTGLQVKLARAKICSLSSAEYFSILPSL